MLDARYVRENLETVNAAMKLRHFDAWDPEAFTSLDSKRRELIAKVEALQAKRNSSSKEIGKLMKSGQKEEAEAKKAEVKEVNAQIESLSAERDEVEAALNKILMGSPNIPHESVPEGKDDTENVEIRRWGTPREFGFDFKPHWDLGTDLGIIDFERGVKLTQARFIVLGGQGAMLERALITFMIDTHLSNGFKEWWLPVLANGDTLTGTGQLPKFEDDLFKTTGGLYLIPTAEVMLTNLHRGEVVPEEKLPLKYCAFTPCFREEAGSAGRDTRGLIRVHEFDKVEMVKFATPETSYDELESMTASAEDILQKLGLPYRVVTLCSGDLGFSAAKTYDLEVWLPSYDNYKEISSCSCCSDFQARRANIKYRKADDGRTAYLHTLNGSGLAVGRTMAAVLENYQQEDGTVKVPDVLVPYMHGQEYIVPEETL